jgi:hypothetical protein
VLSFELWNLWAKVVHGHRLRMGSSTTFRYFASQKFRVTPDHVVSLVQGQILVASHSLYAISYSFVLFPCTWMLVFKLELVHQVNEIITRPFTLFHGVNGDGELAWMALLLSALVFGKQNRLFISWSSSVAPNCWSCLGHCLGQIVRQLSPGPTTEFCLPSHASYPLPCCC